MRLFPLSFLILLAAAGNAPATATAAQGEPAIAVLPTIGEQDLRRFGRDRVRDIRRLLFGPGQLQAVTVPSLDCRELYARRVALMQADVDHGRRFTDEPRHAAAVFVGAVWTPAFYYLPYRAVSEFSRAGQRTQAAAELAALRRASAAARCFEY